MRREFICHRCGTANQRQAENCKFCGLQVGWRPGIPGFIRFWKWPAARQETAGSLAAPLAVMVEATYPGMWASYVFSAPLLLFSAAMLFWATFVQWPGGERAE